MSKEFFNRDMRLFVDHRVDWGRYLRLRRARDVDLEGELAAYRTVLATAGDVCEHIESLTRPHWHEASGALLGDPQYALLNAKRVCEMVIDVVAAAELLLQADLGDGKPELAATFVHRRMLAVEMNARRISSGDASRIKRYDRILGL